MLEIKTLRKQKQKQEALKFMITLGYMASPRIALNYRVRSYH